MAKFVAKQAYASQALLGLGVFSSPQGARFDDIEGSGFTVQTTGGIMLEVGGSGFKSTFLGAGQPKAVGTVTSIKYYSNDTLIYKLSGAKYPFKDLAESSDSLKHTQKIFAGDDVFKGSFSNDILWGFSGSDRMDGSPGADTLYGEGGKDILIGGDGYDSLDGGKGKDTYVFNTDPALGYDTITKYEKGEHIQLKAKSFPGLEPGELLPEHFVFGSGAQDADDRVIYNPDNGFLYHDADGNGSVAASPFARIANYQGGLEHFGPEDFLII